MPLIRQLKLYFPILLPLLFGGQAQAAISQIELQTFPKLDHVRPHSDPVRISLSALDDTGRSAEGALFHIRLYAPSPGGFFSTDFPRVEGTRLIEMELPAPQGSTAWQYVLPIRGVYRLEVSAVHDGEQIKKVFTLRIKESRVKLIYLGGFVIALFLLGVAAGRLFAPATQGTKLNIKGCLLWILLDLAISLTANGEPRPNGVSRGGN